MPYEVHTAPGESVPDEADSGTTAGHGQPLWEVFVRQRRGLSHVHAGSVHAPDAETALQNARDVYTRRVEGTSIWVVPSTAIVASDPEAADEWFDPFADKPYRHPTFYEIPEEVGHM
jgi:ring-1,2-phenylacetyl-CoA epoxidase subunit PaaB